MKTFFTKLKEGAKEQKASMRNNAARLGGPDTATKYKKSTKMSLAKSHLYIKDAFCSQCLQFECAHHFDIERHHFNKYPKNQQIKLSEDMGFITEKELKKTRSKNKALDRMLGYHEQKQRELQEL